MVSGARLQPRGPDEVRRQDRERRHRTRLRGEGEEGHVQEADQQAGWEGHGQAVQEGDSYQEPADLGAAQGDSSRWAGFIINYRNKSKQSKKISLILL